MKEKWLILYNSAINNTKVINQNKNAFNYSILRLNSLKINQQKQGFLRILNYVFSIYNIWDIRNAYIVSGHCWKKIPTV